MEPGFGGQSFMRDQLEKVRRIREVQPNLDIQVDGGVNLENIGECARAGKHFFLKFWQLSLFVFFNPI